MGSGAEDDLQTGKKVRQTTREPSWAQFMLRCAQLGLSDEALSNMTMGMVYDMIIEKNNDSYEYPYQATQEDILAFFPK